MVQWFDGDLIHTLFDDLPVLVFRTVMTFVVVMLIMRWTGKRSIANLAPFDLAMVIVIGEVAAIPVADLTVDLLHGIVPVTLIGTLHVTMTYLASRSVKFEEWTEGTPTLLVKNGRVLKRNLLKERVSMADLLTALRHKEVLDVHEVKEAWIEHAGGVSVIKKDIADETPPRHLEEAIERIVEANAVRMRQELAALLRSQPPRTER